ncbi:MAG: ribosomal protein S18-alanine N-acetyltransferase [Nitrososphaerota archaeon]|nr:ribosomal protein S18-alanine N-acetyltransferase [Nitrososphaerales archaeon]MDW8044251.1 ribosomal protein S18-alanine N-acetyltransferase [Nitrososphaerota archaeon]
MNEAIMIPLIKVRRCEWRDLNRVLEIERSSFDQPYDLSIFIYYLTNESERFLVAEEDDYVVGYIISSILNDVGLIISLAVDERWRRKGVGTKLLEMALQHLSNRVKRVELQVRVSNESAIQFYRRFGFRIKKRIERYYLDGEDAYLMVKDFI